MKNPRTVVHLRPNEVVARNEDNTVPGIQKLDWMSKVRYRRKLDFISAPISDNNIGMNEYKAAQGRSQVTMT